MKNITLKIWIGIVLSVVFVIGFTTPIIAGEMIDKHLEYQGLDRTITIYLPDGHTRSAVLAFHGHGGNGKDMMLGYGLMDKADKDGTIIVSVDGYPSDGSHWFKGARGWNGYHCCGSSFENNIDDVGFVAYLIRYLQYTYGIDDVAAIGFSNGGMFLHRFASERSDEINRLLRAPFRFADISGTIGGQSEVYPNQIRMPSPPLDKVSVVMVHGKKDPLVTYDNSWPADGARVDIPFEDGVKFWRGVGGYDLEETAIANAKARTVLDAEVKSYRSSQAESIRNHYGMLTIVFPNGEHECPAWPWVLDMVWEFFKDHAK